MDSSAIKSEASSASLNDVPATISPQQESNSWDDSNDSEHEYNETSSDEEIIDSSRREYELPSEYEDSEASSSPPSTNLAPSTTNNIDTCLVRMHCRFAGSPTPRPYAGVFTIAGDPAKWDGTRRYEISDAIEQITDPTQLLLVILYSDVLPDVLEVTRRRFWLKLGETACDALFGLENAPDKYICAIQDLDPAKTNHFKRIPCHKRAAFAAVTPDGTVKWLRYGDGRALSLRAGDQALAIDVQYI